MPRYPINRATNFIVEDESWTVVEYDHTSVPGVIYLSLTEGKINSIYDDLKNNIADTDKLANYKIIVPAEKQNFAIGQTIIPSFTLTKNGIPIDAEIELLPTDKKVARIIDGALTAVGNGETKIMVRLKDYPSIFDYIDVVIDTEPEVFSAYIEGKDSIRLDRESMYKLIGTNDLDDEVEFSIDTTLATIKKIDSSSCLIHTNNKNLLGSFTLTATYKGTSYTKEISVIPLW